MIKCNYCDDEKDIKDFRRFKKDPLCQECFKKEKRDKYRIDNPISNNCIYCGLGREEIEFVKDKNSCKDCQRNYRKEYYENNREFYINYSKIKSNLPKRKEKQKEYILKNKDKIKKYQEKYREENKEKLKIKRSERWKNLRENYPHIIAWRSVLKGVIKRMNTQKSKSTIEMLGYSAEDLRKHLESLFLENMSWENWGDWHIDHKIPISKFDRETPVDVVNALDNLQPLWALDNIKKGNK